MSKVKSIEELLLHDPARLAPLPVATVQQAARVVDQERLPELLAVWEAEDRQERGTRAGGRPGIISMRSILILWVILAVEKQPLHTRRIADILTDRLKRKAAEELGITRDPNVAPDAWYERARRATERVLRLIDAHPLPDRRRCLEKRELEQVFARREESSAALSVKEQRAQTLMNGLLHATYLMLPEQYRTQDVSLAVDATAIELYARGVGKKRLAAMDSDGHVSIEPDAGFYARDTVDHAPTKDSKPHKLKYAVELELAILSSNDPKQPDAVPHIVLGIGMHAPAYGPGRAARAVFESIANRGLKFDHITGDRAYFPGAEADELQNYLRAKHAKLVMTYHKNFLGKVTSHAGAIQVEGNWYCPSMPEDLIQASLTRRLEDDADRKNKALPYAERRARMAERDALWAERIAARAPYLLRQKEQADASGTTPMMCPAVGGSATANCDIKTARRSDGRTALTVITAPPKQGRICTNKTSVAFPGDAGGKFAQHYQYGTAEWAAHYAHGRNAIESFNGYAKDGASHALRDAARRRLRGFAAQFLLGTLTVVAANLAKIRSFLFEHLEQAADLEDGKTIAPEDRRRRSRRSTPTQRITHRGRRTRKPTRT